jgi:signal transduction histidine kinase
MKSKLQIKFLSWFLIFSVIPLVIITLSGLSLVRNVIVSSVQSKIQFVSRILSEKIENYYTDILQDVRKYKNSSYFPIYSGYLKNKISDENIIKLVDTQLDNDHFISYSVLTLDILTRKITFVNHPVKDERLLEYLKRYKDNEIAITPIFPGKSETQYIIVPLYSENGKILTYVFQVDLGFLCSTFNSIISKEDQLQYILLSSGNFVRSSIREMNQRNYANIEYYSNSLTFMRNKFFYKSLNYPKYKLFINVLADQKQNLTTLATIKKRYTFAILLFIVLLFVFAYYVSHTITQAVQKLIEMIKNIGDGNFELNINIESGDEFEELAEKINEMKEKLRHYNNLLENEVVLRTEELQSARKQIQHQEKMINLGMLAAGVAHEIGNPLTSISNLTQILLKKCQNEKEKTYLELMKKNIDRISEIVGDLVNFSRPSPEKFELVSINQIVEQAIKIVKFDKRGKNVKYITLLDDQNPMAEIIEGQLLQVLVNLLFNAIDAVNPENGIITITTATQGKFVSIKVGDNGEGIPRELHEKIFEPFFTTKEVGKGTGLGLAVSYTIIKNFNGNITLRSEPGMGTEFEIILPVKQKEKTLNEGKIAYSG